MSQQTNSIRKTNHTFDSELDDVATGNRDTIIKDFHRLNFVFRIWIWKSVDNAGGARFSQHELEKSFKIENSISVAKSDTIERQIPISMSELLKFLLQLKLELHLVVQ